MHVDRFHIASGVILFSLLACHGCNRRPQVTWTPELERANFGRPWMKYGYEGKSPEEILTEIRDADYVEEVLAGLDALAVIGIHYKSEDNYSRALDATKACYEMSQEKWASRSIPARDPADGFSSYEYWSKHNWTFGDVVAARVFSNVSGMCVIRKEDDAFQERCREFYESMRPPEAKPELLRRWEHGRKRSEVLSGNSD